MPQHSSKSVSDKKKLPSQSRTAMVQNSDKAKQDVKLNESLRQAEIRQFEEYVRKRSAAIDAEINRLRSSLNNQTVAAKQGLTTVRSMAVEGLSMDPIETAQRVIPQQKLQFSLQTQKQSDEARGDETTSTEDLLRIIRTSMYYTHCYSEHTAICYTLCCH